MVFHFYIYCFSLECLSLTQNNELVITQMIVNRQHRNGVKTIIALDFDMAKQKVLVRTLKM